MKEKKDIERFYLIKFFEVLGEKPVEIIDSEAPDFIVQTKKKRIGLEVTEYHSTEKGKGSRGKKIPRRAIEEEWKVLQEMIMEEVHKCPDLNGTFGHLYFKNLGLPSRREYIHFVEELIRISIEMNRSGIKKIKPNKSYPLLSKYLYKFILEKVECYITWEWNHNFAWIGLSESELLHILRSKNVDYRDAKLDEVWLIIVSGFRLSQTMPLHLMDKLRLFQEMEQLIKDLKFDKVFIFQYMLNVAYEWPGWIKIGKENFISTTEDKSLVSSDIKNQT